MPVFSEAWYAEHKAKMAALKSEALPPMPDEISFFIPYLLPLPNAIMPTIWFKIKQRKLLTGYLDPILGPYAGRKPHERARVVITRHSVNADHIDLDNAIASVKRLVDLLLVRNKTHPHSYGIITDDNPRCIEIVSEFAKTAHRKDQGTSVIIKALPHG